MLAAYVVVLPIVIILLEMHYVVDIPVGFAVAGLVIVVSNPSAWRSVQRLLRAGLNLGRSRKSAVYAPS